MEKQNRHERKPHWFHFFSIYFFAVLALITFLIFAGFHRHLPFAPLWNASSSIPGICISRIIIRGISFIILEAGFLGLAFFFSWQLFQIKLHELKMKEREFEEMLKENERKQLEKETQDRREFDRQRNELNDKFRMLEILKKKTVTEPVVVKVNPEDTTKPQEIHLEKTTTTEGFTMDQVKELFPVFFETKNV